MSKWNYIDLLNFGNMSYERLNLTWDEVEYCVHQITKKIKAKNILLNLKVDNQSLFLSDGSLKSSEYNYLVFNFYIPISRNKSEILIESTRTELSSEDQKYLSILEKIIVKLVGLKNCLFSPVHDLKFNLVDANWCLEFDNSGMPHCSYGHRNIDSVSEVEFNENFWLSVDPLDRGKFIFEMNELLEFSKEINFNFEFYDFKNNKIVKFNRVGEMEGVNKAVGECRILSTIENIKIKKYVNSLNSGVIVFDPNGDVIEVNDHALEILNVSEEEIRNDFFFNGQCKLRTLDLSELKRKDFPTNKVEAINAPVISEIIGVQRAEGNRVQWLKCSAIFQYFSGKRYTLFTFVDESIQVNNSQELSKFFNLSLNLLCIANVDGTFEKINPQFKNLLGFEDQEILSTPILDFVHPDDREKTVKALEQLGKGKEVVNFENRYYAKDKSLKYIAWAAAPEKTSGKIYAVGVNRTEERLKQKNAIKISQLRSLYISNRVKSFEFWDKTLSLILEVTESKFGFLGEIKVNDQGEKYLKTFSLTNISWSDETRELYANMSRSGFEFANLNTLFGQVIKTGKPLLTNAPKNHPKAGGIPNGHPPLNAFMGVPLHYAGKMIGMLGVANRDEGYDDIFLNNLNEIFDSISSIVNAFLLERDLAEVEKLNSFYKMAIDKAAIVSFCNADGEISYVNDKFCEVSGYDRTELIGENYRILKSGEMDDDFFKNMWETITSGNQWHGQICNKAKDGTLFWVDSTIIPFFNQSNEINQFISIKRDITKEIEQKNLEFAYQRAEEATKAKSEFLSTMSHEIRTPLNGVLGMTEVLADTNLSEEQEKIVEAITNSGNSLMSIINDILDFSKIEAGQLKLDLRECDLEEFTKKLISPFYFSCNAKNLNFKFQINKSLERMVMVDEVRLGQVISNLISNAIKFTETGEIKFDLNVSENRGSVDLVFKIKDSGIGINDEDISDIFIPFSQAKNRTSPNQPGTGLGLSISKKIVDAMGGVIYAESKVGEGSTFIFEVNLRQGQKIDQGMLSNGLSQEVEREQTGASILIAEDNHTNQTVISKFVEKMGHTPTCVSNGQEAIEILGERTFDLILMDCQMPEVDGYSATRIIRASNKSYKEIPIIALTANAVKGDDEICFQCGMNDYLTKPISSDLLKEKINLILKDREKSKVECLNLNRVYDLKEKDFSGDQELFFKTIKVFIDDSKKQIKIMNDSIERNDVKKMRATAHSLKSSSALLGADNLSEMCLDFERLQEIPEGFVERKQMMDDLERLHEETIKELVFIANSYVPIAA